MNNDKKDDDIMILEDKGKERKNKTKMKQKYRPHGEFVPGRRMGAINVPADNMSQKISNILK